MSLSVSIQQFSGGVTEIPPTIALVKNSNYLWEIMGKYGIAARRYTGGGGAVSGIGGGGTSGTGKIPYELSVIIPGSGSQGSTYQNDDLINAVDINFIILNNTLYSLDAGNFTFNYLTGTIDLSPSSNNFFGQDVLIVPYSKYVNTAASISSPQNTTIYFNNVPTYDLAWSQALIAKYGSGADFSVEILGDDGVYRVTIVQITPNNINNTTSYHFDFGGVSTGRIIF